VATFEINLLENNLENKPNNEADIQLYEAGIERILIRLNERLEKSPCDPLLEELLERKGTFAPQAVDIQYHPDVWPQSHRVGRSEILVKSGPQKDTATFTLLTNSLNQIAKSLPRSQRKEVYQALDELTQWHNDVATAYLVRLRDATVDELIKKLSDDVTPHLKEMHFSAKNIETWQKSDAVEEKKNFKNSLLEIKALAEKKLRTRAACLEATQKVNTLRNELVQFNLKHPELKIDHLAEQLSVVTKRWIDPFYENPKEYTKIEMARRIFKLVIINLAEVLAVTALILFFVFPPASFPIGAAAAIGMIPIFDSAFELARNVWYGRTPTKMQMVEVGIASFIVVGLGFCAYGVTMFGTAILNSAPEIASNMIRFGNAMATIFMRYIDAGLNTIGILVDNLLFREEMQPKTTKHLVNSSVKLKQALQVIHDSDKNLKVKLATIVDVDELSAQLADKSKGDTYYICKNKDNAGSIDNIHRIFSISAEKPDPEAKPQIKGYLCKV